jgi:hypothetical protein
MKEINTMGRKKGLKEAILVIQFAIIMQDFQYYNVLVRLYMNGGLIRQEEDMSGEDTKPWRFGKSTDLVKQL